VKGRSTKAEVIPFLSRASLEAADVKRIIDFTIDKFKRLAILFTMPESL